MYDISSGSAGKKPTAISRNQFLLLVSQDQSFGILRACLGQLTGGLHSMLDGFKKYSVKGQSYLIPDPTFRMELMLPPEHIKWLIEQPESVLSHWKVRDERHALDHTVGDIDRPPTMGFVSRIIQNVLVRKMNSVQAAIYRAISTTVDQTFGDDTMDWKEHNLDHSMEEIVGAAMTRVLYGVLLSQDRSFRWNFNMMVKATGITKLVLGQTPKPIQPLFATLLSIPLRYFRAQAMKPLVAVVRRRFAEAGDMAGAGIFGDEQDLVQQAIRSMDSLVGEPMSPELLAQRLLILGFAGTSPTTSVAATTMVDILETPVDQDVRGRIRAETATHLATESAWNNPESFAGLAVTNSVIHESLRMRPTMLKGLTREVVPKEGIQTPDGMRVPEGAWMSVPVHAIHMDDRLYDDPARYNAFRFLSTSANESKDLGGGYSDQPSPSFLTFGFGRYTCSGRKYGVHILKVLLAYIFVNYDVELLSKPAKFASIGDVGLPPIGMTIRVRRRAKLATETS